MKLSCSNFKKFFIFQKRKARKKNLYFRKQNFFIFPERYIQNPGITELPCSFGNEAFLSIFQEVTFRAQKLKRTHSKKCLIFWEIELSSPTLIFFFCFRREHSYLKNQKILVFLFKYKRKRKKVTYTFPYKEENFLN